MGTVASHQAESLPSFQQWHPRLDQVNTLTLSIFHHQRISLSLAWLAGHARCQYKSFLDETIISEYMHQFMCCGDSEIAFLLKDLQLFQIQPSVIIRFVFCNEFLHWRKSSANKFKFIDHVNLLKQTLIQMHEQWGLILEQQKNGNIAIDIAVQILKASESGSTYPNKEETIEHVRKCLCKNETVFTKLALIAPIQPQMKLYDVFVSLEKLLFIPAVMIDLRVVKYKSHRWYSIRNAGHLSLNDVNINLMDIIELKIIGTHIGRGSGKNKTVKKSGQKGKNIKMTKGIQFAEPIKYDPKEKFEDDIFEKKVTLDSNLEIDEESLGSDFSSSEYDPDDTSDSDYEPEENAKSKQSARKQTRKRATNSKNKSNHRKKRTKSQGRKDGDMYVSIQRATNAQVNLEEVIYDNDEIQQELSRPVPKKLDPNNYNPKEMKVYTSTSKVNNIMFDLIARFKLWSMNKKNDTAAEEMPQDLKESIVRLRITDSKKSQKPTTTTEEQKIKNLIKNKSKWLKKYDCKLIQNETRILLMLDNKYIVTEQMLPAFISVWHNINGCFKKTIFAKHINDHYAAKGLSIVLKTVIDLDMKDCENCCQRRMSVKKGVHPGEIIVFRPNQIIMVC